MNINQIYKNIEELENELDEDTLKRMQQTSLEKYPNGPTVNEFLNYHTKNSIRFLASRSILKSYIINRFGTDFYKSLVELAVHDCESQLIMMLTYVWCNAPRSEVKNTEEYKLLTEIVLG